MNSLFIVRNHRAGCFGRLPLINVWALLFCFSLGTLAHGASPAENASAAFSIRATPLLGLEDTKSNRTGTLSVQGDELQFRQGAQLGAQIKISAIRGVFIGGESKQVGGLPMKLGKAAAPYGGGRVVSLFAHKHYDTLTLEYVDNGGGMHGAIFQLDSGQGEQVRNELLARGGPSASREDQPTRQNTAEITHENK